jgi:hypothetical protein
LAGKKKETANVPCEPKKEMGKQQKIKRNEKLE